MHEKAEFEDAVELESSEKSSEKIQSLMRRNPLATIQEMATDLGVSTRAIEKQIAKLKEAGQITRIGPDKGGHWKVMASPKKI